MIAQTGEQGDDEEGAGQDVQGFHRDNRHSSLAIFNNVLTVSELVYGEEGADEPQPHPRGLLEGVGWGYKKSNGYRLCQGNSAVVWAQRKVCCDCRWL